MNFFSCIFNSESSVFFGWNPFYPHYECQKSRVRQTLSSYCHQPFKTQTDEDIKISFSDNSSKLKDLRLGFKVISMFTQFLYVSVRKLPGTFSSREGRQSGTFPSLVVLTWYWKISFVKCQSICSY